MTFQIVFIMNQTERYRLEALMELAKCFPERRSATQIANRRGIPSAYLSRLLADLAREGWVRSRRGPGGGVALAHPPETISVAAVISSRVADGSLPPVLERLATTINRAVEASTTTISIADLTHWERQSKTQHDYSI